MQYGAERDHTCVFLCQNCTVFISKKSSKKIITRAQHPSKNTNARVMRVSSSSVSSNYVLKQVLLRNRRIYADGEPTCDPNESLRAQ